MEVVIKQRKQFIRSDTLSKIAYDYSKTDELQQFEYRGYK